MSFDALAPYGEIIESTVRIATWNTWARFGDWEQRQVGIEQTLVEVQPDVVLLTEAWASGEDTQADRVAAQLGFAHAHHFGDRQDPDSGDTHTSAGTGVVSRWPIVETQSRALPGGHERGFPGSAVYALIDGPRGVLQTFTVMLDYPLYRSARRQVQVRELCDFVGDMTDPKHPIVVCGDFNAGPDSDEIRMLTGKAATPVDRLVFYDSWEIAGNGTEGLTWSNENPLAALSMYPNRRFDYIFSAWPRAGAAGHPVHCERMGILPPGQPQLSDHYGVVADLRY